MIRQGKLSAIGFGIWAVCCVFVLAAWADITTAEKYFLEGKYERSVTEADKLIETKAHHMDELYYLKGLSQLKLKKFEDARQSFERLLAKYPRSNRVFNANIGIGDSYLLANDTDKAMKVYNDILGKFPNDRNVGVLYDRLAASYRKVGNDARAEEYEKKLNACAPLSFEASQNANEVRRAAPIVREEPVSNFTAKRSLPAEAGINSVQVGCFKNKKNAEKLRKKLKKEGYDGYIESPGRSADKLYRVKVGRLSTGQDAEALSAKLKKDGYSTKICLDDVFQ